MTPEQITTLAREYAEEVHKKVHKEMEVLPNCLSNEAINMLAGDMKCKLEWLSSRFCLVEKSKAEQFFKGRQNILANQNKYDRYIVDEASAEKRLMLCLFPEIAKEVEE